MVLRQLNLRPYCSLFAYPKELMIGELTKIQPVSN